MTTGQVPLEDSIREAVEYVLQSAISTGLMDLDEDEFTAISYVTTSAVLAKLPPSAFSSRVPATQDESG